MGRIARVVIPDVPVHITQRGNQGQDVFLADYDRRIYLEKLKFYADRFKMDVLGYCLMTNHVHIIAVPRRDDSLAKALGRTHNDYSRWLHIRQGVVGHLWQNRFFSCALDNHHLWQALRYVERNPVRAGLVWHPEEWLWSSAQAHLQGADPSGLLNFDRWKQLYSPSQWREVLEASIADEAFSRRLREATRTGRPSGSPEFIQRLESLTGKVFTRQKTGKRPTGKEGSGGESAAESAIA